MAISYSTYFDYGMYEQTAVCTVSSIEQIHDEHISNPSIVYYSYYL